MPEVKHYDRFIQIVETAKEFEKAVEKSLVESKEEVAARIEAMLKETWPMKLQQISNRLQ